MDDDHKDGAPPEQIESLLAAPELADALESTQFRRFLDQIPIAIIVSEMKSPEAIVYANPEFERLSGRTAADLDAQPWSVLEGTDCDDASRHLGEAIAGSSDFVGTYRIERAGLEPAFVDVYSDVIENERGVPCYRLAALVDVGQHEPARRHELEQKVRVKDALLLEIQHRVKNNLQMITALIRIEARNAQGRMDTAPFQRLAGRIEAMQLLYALLSEQPENDEVDLGIYLSNIASAVLAAHAVEGIRLNLQVDVYPVSVNVAMPTGLVVNELLTNALKYAFEGRDGGTITLHSFTENNGCRIVIADDGVGLPDGVQWPQRGKLSAAIVHSLRENAKAKLTMVSRPGEGVKVTILFQREAALPNA